ncbi:MAG TPA: glycine cleavage system protein GcvH [Deltaproteobacteria bacterium]|nr:MAG: glycine cleavage system protein H [Deltaproteobacteria bacterium GWA2_55_82]OGQ64278.1 MAG: glycine cleavage system protein H [Deltaproteobacteria bacterium RIFCSPLOWO2_02_FULL_55_12]OIJ73978.1 MAG: glycine cleavage system protein H [Deltaproteobacteria bacterium GWC2_55_46]HBG46579.1 glycine cleavage system protein GcvH [Deltaproteobacteria bacterium]HCY09981.1 glycine cleavage system protein GcvH [Deltaproteobacteria bacterium]
MEFPKDLKYTKEHEWIKVEGKTATVGITDYAQDSLGDVVYVELPQEGGSVTKHEPFGVVESVKAVSDLYSPVSGSVTEVNDAIIDSPEVINEDPYGDAWMIKVEISSNSDLDDLLTADEYQKFIEEEK